MFDDWSGLKMGSKFLHLTLICRRCGRRVEVPLGTIASPGSLVSDSATVTSDDIGRRSSPLSAMLQNRHFE